METKTISQIMETLPVTDKSSKPENSTIKPIFDPNEFREFFLRILIDRISHSGKKFVVNEENEKVIDLICQYMNREPEFIENGFSFDKGIWIGGKFGSGKTQIIKTYRDVRKLLFNQTVGFKTCRQMNEYFLMKNEYTGQIEGEKGIETFTNKFDKLERIFDDLGEEEVKIMDYGNKSSVMTLILSSRYNIPKKNLTHVTTNLTRLEIESLYGGRIESRIYEMFNFFALGGKKSSEDYRKI